MTRRRELIAIILVAILAVALLATIYFLRSGGQTPTTTTTSAVPSSPIPVGTVLYLWYGNATTGIGELGSPGWNSSSCPGGGAVVDKPSIGYYVSDSNKAFQTQISEMQNAGISFAIVSWWGPFTTGEAGAVNKATLDLFSYLKSTNSTFKVAVMIDAFSTVGCLPSVPMSHVYDYIYGSFAAPFRQWYFDWQGKPFLMTFNPIEPLYSDTRFTSRMIGNYACKPVETCPGHSLNQKLDWIWWEAPANFSVGEGGIGANATNDEGNPVISSDGEVTIIPRIDSYYNYAAGQQQGYLRFDPGLRLGLYQFEWNFVLEHRSSVKLVLIYSFNEFHERSAIEPLASLGSQPLSDQLLNITVYYTALLGKPDFP